MAALKGRRAIPDRDLSRLSLDALHDTIMALDFDEAVYQSDRFNQETITEARERPPEMRDRFVVFVNRGDDAGF